jgi:hypothetical protein
VRPHGSGGDRARAAGRCAVVRLFQSSFIARLC